MNKIMLFEEFVAQKLNENKLPIKVGDIVGNTVQGFNWKVLKIKKSSLEVQHVKTGEKKETHIDNMYKSQYESAEFVNENRDPKSIRKEYADLKKLSIQSLRDMWSRTYRVGNPKELDKEGLVMDILIAKHGVKYIEAAFESSENSLTDFSTTFNENLGPEPIDFYVNDFIENVLKLGTSNNLFDKYIKTKKLNKNELSTFVKAVVEKIQKSWI